MKMEQTASSKMSAHKIQTPGHQPQERIQQSTLHARHSLTSVELQVLLNLGDMDAIPYAFNRINERGRAIQ